MKLKSLSDLKQVKKAIDAQAAAQAEQARRQAAEEKQRQARHHLFETAVGKVQKLAPPRVASLRPAPPRPEPLQQQADEAAALQEALSDEVDIASLLETDEQLSYRRSGVGVDVTRKLRKGQWAVQRQIDLHGLRSDEAREALGQFIRESHRLGIRCVRVVHGKGLGSPGKTPVLKAKVQRWLVQKNEVIAFVQAAPAQGGAGAMLVLLQPAGA